MKNHIFKITANLFAVLFLVALVSTPFYFARNFSQVSGVRSEAAYLVVSQAQKFPDMHLSQTGDRYEISFERQNPSQAYLGVMVINNPSSQSKTYSFQASTGSTKVFFGEDIDNQISSIRVPPGTSVPVSLISEGKTASTQTIEFSIITE